MSNVESRAAQSAARQGPQASNGAPPSEHAPMWTGDPSLGRTIERDLVPRLLLAHRAGPFPPLEQSLITRATTAVCADERHTFLELVLGSDEDAATHFVAQMVARGRDLTACRQETALTRDGKPHHIQPPLRHQGRQLGRRRGSADLHAPPVAHEELGDHRQP